MRRRRPTLVRLPVGRARGYRPTPPPESILSWWHPSRPGVRSGPAWFDKKLLEVSDGELAVTWNAYIERWMVWVKAPRIHNSFVQRWNLLFVVREDDGSYRPLDERTLARLYSASMRQWGTAKRYWEAVEREMARDKEARARSTWNDTLSQAMESFDHSQIKVGWGPSSGSKFSTYHS
jgi:hypothetical protein